MNLEFTVPDMACSACAAKITQAVHAIDPEAKINADPNTKLVTIETAQPKEMMQQTITAAGYTPQA